ncbi:hypothetical protein DU500_05395 [Haloplanus rubicundus]|uniref:Uncharacterized protein n=1 Tax=Haloplanus rubicundus TaxID=1547898 RepID=A0A345E148_9EURY|nr:hypothetical protein [Haloplanus rubicundus]AXG05920.1 hypothetical protein DU500_05395 [Haloplanus rubicundus]
MRFKPVPPAPEAFEYVTRVQRAVPLVPGTEDDCCARLVGRLDLSDRDAARTWLTFLRALELAEETPSGYRRTDAEPTVEGCREAFLTRVFAADAVRDALASEGPLAVDAAFEAVRERVPRWERHRDAEWTAVWRERVGRLLDWLVLLEAAERGDDDPSRYRLT